MQTRTAVATTVTLAATAATGVVVLRWGRDRLDRARRRVQDVREEPSVEATAGLFRAQYERFANRLPRKGSSTSTTVPSLAGPRPTDA